MQQKRTDPRFFLPFGGQFFSLLGSANFRNLSFVNSHSGVGPLFCREDFFALSFAVIYINFSGHPVFVSSFSSSLLLGKTVFYLYIGLYLLLLSLV